MTGHAFLLHHRHLDFAILLSELIWVFPPLFRKKVCFEKITFSLLKVIQNFYSTARAVSVPLLKALSEHIYKRGVAESAAVTRSDVTDGADKGGSVMDYLKWQFPCKEGTHPRRGTRQKTKQLKAG